MALAHEIGKNGYWTGNTVEIIPRVGLPGGYTRAPFPDLEEGEYALWNGKWVVTTTPPPPIKPDVPEEITRRQARQALLAAGLLSQADTLVNSLPGVQGEAARNDWYHSLGVRRDNPLILTMAAQITLPDGTVGLTEDQLDELFINGATYV